MPQDESCVMCGEAITNPLCLACIQKEIEQWIAAKRASLVPLVRAMSEPFYSYGQQGISCIKCRNNMTVCGHCYAKEMHGWISETYPEYAEEFVERFNFELSIPCKF